MLVSQLLKESIDFYIEDPVLYELKDYRSISIITVNCKTWNVTGILKMTEIHSQCHFQG